MRIRDIIEAAIEHQEKLNDRIDRPYALSTTLGGLYRIREEVALMEAVCEAAEARHQEWTRDTYIAIDDAIAALQAYRKERGL